MEEAAEITITSGYLEGEIVEKLLSDNKVRDSQYILNSEKSFQNKLITVGTAICKTFLLRYDLIWREIFTKSAPGIAGIDHNIPK